MQQALFEKFSSVKVAYKFKCRNTPKIDLLPYKGAIIREIYNLANLRFTHEDREYLRSLDFMKDSYVDMLRYFRLQPDKYVNISEKDGELDIRISGNWFDIILFEVPILAIVSEVYSIAQCNETRINGATANEYFTGTRRIMAKLKQINKTNIRFTDFGTRRRFCRRWHNEILRLVTQYAPQQTFVGTSNVYLARKYNVRPIGTMAHEWIQAGQGMWQQTSIANSQRFMLQSWADVYRGDLGIALSDTLGFDVFLSDFDMYFAKLFDGCRHDSGNPDVWCNKLINHYKSMDINPKTKTAVFSDGLTFPEMVRIHNKFSNKINVSFGIGTNLTNDCGVTPLQIVIKMIECNGKPVAKISDSKGKGMCESPEYLAHLKDIIKWKIS